MEIAQHAPLVLRGSRLLQEVFEESRRFWDGGRIRLALGIVAGMLVLEVLIAAAMFAGAEGQFGRAPQPLYALIAGFFGLAPRWAMAIFVAKVHPEHTVPGFEVNLRDPFWLTADLLQDVASMAVTYLLPIFAAIAFTAGSDATPRETSAGRRLLKRTLATVGPLALFALTLSFAGVVVRDVLSFFSAPSADPGAYPIDRFVGAPWGGAVVNWLFITPSIGTSFLLIPTVAAIFRDRHQALAACLGTSLFVMPLLSMAFWFYPGGFEAIPHFLAFHGIEIIKLLVFVAAVPFALRALQCDPPAIEA